MTGGRFHPKDDTAEEIEAARLAAVKRREELERGHLVVERCEASDWSKAVERKSGVSGVCWVKHEEAWKVQIRMETGSKRSRTCKRFRPKDHTPEQIERARLAAVEWLQQVKQQSRAGSQRVGPAKKLKTKR